MKRFIFVLVLVLAYGTASQGYYISEVVVTPAGPTTVDEVSITVSGCAPATNYVLDHVDTWRLGSMIFVDMYWTSVAMGGAAMTPYKQTVLLGTLPAGKYTVYVRSHYAGLVKKRQSCSFTVSKEPSSDPDPWSWSWSWSWNDWPGLSFSSALSIVRGSGGGSTSIVTATSAGSASSTATTSTIAGISN